MILLELSGIAGRVLYTKNLERIQPSSHPGMSITAGSYPRKSLAFLWKDIRIFFRDPGQWSQLFIIGALILIYTYNFSTLPVRTLSDAFPFVKEFLVLINMLMAGLVLSAVAARFLYSSVSLEGMAFWIIRTSPVTIKNLMFSKFFYGFVPVTLALFTVVFIANTAMQIDTSLTILSDGYNTSPLYFHKRTRDRHGSNVSQIQARKCRCYFNEPGRHVLYAHCLSHRVADGFH